MRTSIPSGLRTSILALATALALSLSGCTSPQRCAVGSAGCVCDASDGCDTGLSCTSDHRCVDSSTVVCYDACRWNGDGVCDDGGPGAAYSACAYGSDCSDCLARPNTCTDPAYPVYCPNTASTTGGPCWSPNTDCASIVDCSGTINGCTDGLRFDCTTQTCVTNDCATNTWDRTYCETGAQCYPSLTDCSTVIDCGGTFSGCFVGGTSSCSASNVFSCN